MIRRLWHWFARRRLLREPEVIHARAVIASYCWPKMPRLFLTTDELEVRYARFVSGENRGSFTFAQYVDPWVESGLLIITK